jgi:hypothetical protein
MCTNQGIRGTRWIKNYDKEGKRRLQSMGKQGKDKLAMVEFADTGANPGTVMIEFHHTSPTSVTVFHSVAFHALAQFAEQL